VRGGETAKREKAFFVYTKNEMRHVKANTNLMSFLATTKAQSDDKIHKWDLAARTRGTSCEIMTAEMCNYCQRFS
jgi:hypothetical protein